MASEVKADKLSPSTGTSLQLGDASDTITIPTGATFTITDGLGVAGGGTGLTSFTAGDILYATGTTTLAKLAKGSAEQVLAMNSGATAPDWGSVDLTVLPTITAAKGGTGQTSYTAGDIVYASGTTAVSKLGVGTALQTLQTNSGATAPEWVNSPQSLMTAAGDILYASGANTLAKLAKGSDDEVLTLASGVPSWASAAGGGKIGQVVQTVLTTEVGRSGDSQNWFDVTGMTVAITPSATDSKIIIWLDGKFSPKGGFAFACKLQRDINGGGYNDIYVSTDEQSNQLAANFGAIPPGGSVQWGHGYQFVDSPSWTTGAITYKLQWSNETTGATYLNRTLDDSDSVYYWRGASSITAWELLA